MNSVSKNLQIIFVSQEKQYASDFMIRLLKRHPDFCVFEGTDMLLDNLLKHSHAPYSAHNSIFFELLFELMYDQRFFSAEFTIKEMADISKSKICYHTFQKLMNYYGVRTKTSASKIIYRFHTPFDFRSLVKHYIVKDLQAKYVHVNSDVLQELPGEVHFSNGFMTRDVLQVIQKDFILHYENEYKQLFDFLNTPSALEVKKLEKKNKKLYKKSGKLNSIENSWYRQIVSINKNVHEKIFVERIFKD